MAVIFPVAGLTTDQHPVAVPGGFAQADGVVADLPNQLRGRPCFELVTELSGNVYIPNSINVFQDSAVVSAVHEVTSSDWILRGLNGVILGPGKPPDSEIPVQGALSRKSLYLTTSPYPVRVNNAEATESFKAGLDPTFAPAWQSVPGAITSVSGPFSAPFSVGYKAVVKRTDANGYIKFSPPSSPYVIRELSSPTSGSIMIAGDDSDNGWYFKSGDLFEGDVIQFYRTLTEPNSTLTVGPDYYLAAAYKITAADIVVGRFPTSQSIYDTKTDDELGEVLYTNQGQQGALGSKYAPPEAKCIALWNRCMWWGNTVEYGRASITINKTAGVSQIGSDDALCVQDVKSGGILSGSSAITGVLNVTGLAVGQYVSDNTSIGPLFPASSLYSFQSGTKIESITGTGPYTLNLSRPAQSSSFFSSASNAQFRVGDVITVTAGTSSTDYVAWSSTGPDNGITTYSINQFKIDSSLSNDLARLEAAATSLAYISTYSLTRGIGLVRGSSFGGSGAPLGTTGGAGQLQLERPEPEGFTVTSTKPLAFSPSLSTTGLVVERESRPNKVFYSLPDEPEAVKLLSNLSIGTEEARILRLVPLRDALMVFKEDGLFRITGNAPDSWNVELVDPTLKLLASDALDTMDGVIYAFTDDGIVIINESGVVQNLSQGKIDTTLYDVTTQILSLGSKCQITCMPRQKLVLLLVPDVSDPDVYQRRSSYCFCWSQVTGNWTRWPDLAWFCAATNPSTGGIFAARTNELDEYNWKIIRDYSGPPRGYDMQYAPIDITQTLDEACFVSDAERGDWVPKAGDWLRGEVNSAAVVFGEDEEAVWFASSAVIDGSGGTNTITYAYIRIVEVSATTGGYNLTLERTPTGILTALDGLTALEGVPVTLEWQPSAVSQGQPPFTRPVWSEAQVAFQRAATSLGTNETALNARIVFNARGDYSSTLPAGVVGNHLRSTVFMRGYRFGFPRATARCSTLAPRLSFSEIDWPWRLAGISLVGAPGSTRTRK